MFHRRGEPRLHSLLTEHAQAVREFVDRASRLEEPQWLAPRAAGKWTPAQETQHVILAYGEFLRQLQENRPMRQRGTWIRRRIARLVGLTSILWLERIPVAVHAPREVRPEWIAAGPDVLLPRLRCEAERFEATFAREWRANPRRRMSHYLFGGLSLDQGIRLVSVHTRHHAAFLPVKEPIS